MERKNISKEKLNFEAQNNNSTVKKVVKGLTAITLASALAVLSSCSTQTLGPNNTNFGGNNNVTAIAPNGEKVNVSEYSQILQNVLTDSYYNNLISSAQSRAAGGDYNYEIENKYESIPYGFLEDQGYDVEKIKNNELACETDVFVIDNDLYIACRVETKSAMDYFTHYVIRYELTKQELSDLNLTHKEISDGGNLCRTVSYQAPFFIQELSLVKNAEVLSVNYLTKSREESAEERVESVGKKYPEIDMSAYGSVNAVSLKRWVETELSDKVISNQYLFYNNAYQSSPVKQIKKIATVIFTGQLGGDPAVVDGHIINGGNQSDMILEQYRNEVANSQVTATFYNTYNSDLINMLDESYNYAYNLTN